MLTALVAALVVRGLYAGYRKPKGKAADGSTEPVGVVQPTWWRGPIRAIFIVCVSASVAAPVVAQNGRSTGVGVQLGSPSGVSVKMIRDSEPHYDFLAAWDFGDFLYLSGHAVWEKRVDDEVAGDLRMFYGPGAFIGFRDNRNSNVVVGFSGAIGAALWYRAFEFFVQLTPRFELAPRTDLGIGGGIGARFHIPKG